MTDQSPAPAFDYTSTSQHAFGTVYHGPMPFNGRDWNVRGKCVVVDGRVRVIKAMEAYAMTRGPDVGDPVGFLLEALEWKK